MVSVNSSQDILSDRAGWFNLGYWDASLGCTDYALSAKELAKRIANTANKASLGRVLDIGCGEGASSILWLEEYNAITIDMVETSKWKIKKLFDLKRNHSKLSEIYQSTHDISPRQKYDTIILVDSAYHLESAKYLAEFAASHLDTSSTLNFSTIIAPDTGSWSPYFTASQIPRPSILTMSKWESILANCGFGCIETSNISDQVLKGFADHISSITPKPWHKPLWWKLFLTSKFALKLWREGYTYQIISAKRQ